MDFDSAECAELIANREYDKIFAHYPIQDEDLFTVQAIHKLVLILICGCSCALNGLLFYLIITQSDGLRSIKQMIMLSCVYDFLFSLYSLNLGSIPGSAFGVLFAYDNQLVHITNYNVMTFLKVFNGMSVIGTWLVVPIQFLWRYHIFRYGCAPRGTFLFILLIFFISIYILNGIVMYLVFGRTSQDDRILIRRILHYNGFYDIHLAEVSGINMSSVYFTAYTFLSRCMLIMVYVVTIFVDLLMTKHWNEQKIQANYRTAKTFSSVKKALRIMALGPFITAVIPTFLIRIFGNQCALHPWALTFTSWLIVLQNLLNAVTTIYFIHPYRRFVVNLGWNSTSRSAVTFEISTRKSTG